MTNGLRNGAVPDTKNHLKNYPSGVRKDMWECIPHPQRHQARGKGTLTSSPPSSGWIPANNNNSNNFIYIAIYTESSVSLNNHKLKTIEKKKLKIHERIIHIQKNNNK